MVLLAMPCKHIVVRHSKPSSSTMMDVRPQEVVLQAGGQPQRTGAVDQRRDAALLVRVPGRGNGEPYAATQRSVCCSWRVCVRVGGLATEGFTRSPTCVRHVGRGHGGAHELPAIVHQGC